MKIKTLIQYAITAAIVGMIAYSLFKPDSKMMLMFRGKVSVRDARVVTGPYPFETDIKMLHDSGITTIVSLLNPALPYEKPMLETEKQTAAKYGMVVLNFPLNPITSILGSEGTERNRKLAEAAVKVIKSSPGKVYMHCYLGIHRVGLVTKMLDAAGVGNDKYVWRQGERSDRTRKLDQAQYDFNAGDYKKVIDALADQKDKTAAELNLLAWSAYRLNDIAAAKEYFDEILKSNPGNADACDGLGYCLLRNGDPAGAEKAFSTALAAVPGDIMALTGLGMADSRLNKPAEARAALEKALKLDPNNEDAKTAYSKLKN